MYGQNDRIAKLKSERRFMRYELSDEEVLSILNWRMAPVGSHLAVTQDDVPEDAIVMSVGYSIQHMGIQVVLGHESFEPLPWGAMIPAAHNARLGIEKVSYL